MQVRLFVSRQIVEWCVIWGKARLGGPPNSSRGEAPYDPSRGYPWDVSGEALNAAHAPHPDGRGGMAIAADDPPKGHP